MQALFEFERCQVVEGRREPPGIVEGFEVVEPHGLGFGTVAREPILEAFGLERGKEAFPRRVVVAAAFLSSYWL